MNVPHAVDAFLVTNPTNIRYLTGFVGVEPRDAYVLVTKNKTYFFTNSLYLEQAKSLSPILLTQEYPISKALQDLHIKKLEFEENNVTVAEYNEFAKFFTLVPTKNRIEKLRQTKRPDEIANIKKACQITDACFDDILPRLTPGVEEGEIAWEIEMFFRKNNAESAFSPIVAFGKNSSQPHYNSLSQGPKEDQSLALKSNNLVLLDFGARINGYCADMTRVILFGPPKEEWTHAYKTVLAAQQKALGLLESGTRNGETLDAAAKEVIAKQNLPPYEHSLGHNVGLDIHEGPRLSVKKDEKLLPGMVFSVEPGVYIEGKYGIRIEDLVRITNTGIEVLTKSPKTPVFL